MTDGCCTGRPRLITRTSQVKSLAPECSGTCTPSRPAFVLWILVRVLPVVWVNPEMTWREARTALTEPADHSLAHGPNTKGPPCLGSMSFSKFNWSVNWVFSAEQSKLALTSLHRVSCSSSKWPYFPVIVLCNTWIIRIISVVQQTNDMDHTQKRSKKVNSLNIISTTSSTLSALLPWLASRVHEISKL